MSLLKRIDYLKKRIEKLEAEERIPADEVLSIAEELFITAIERIDPKLHEHAMKRGVWTIEMLDSAVDKISDALGNSAMVLDLWDELWEALIDRKELNRETLQKLKLILHRIDRRLRD